MNIKKAFKVFLSFLFLFIVIFQEYSFSNNVWEMTDSLKVLVDTTKDGHPIWAKCSSLGLISLNQLEVFWIGNLETESPFIMKSKDSGKTFSVIYRDSLPNKIIDGKIYIPHKVNNYSLPNQKLFIIVGDSGLIIRSTDNGESWIKSKLDEKFNLKFVSFWDELNGLCYGVDINQKGKAFISYDGGVSWKTFNNEPNYNDLNQPYNFYSFENHLLLFLDYYSQKNMFYFHYSDDLGLNWSSYKSIQKYQNCGFKFNNINDAFYFGTEDEDINGKSIRFIYKTENRGITWEKVFNQTENLNFKNGSISFSDSNNGILSGYYTIWRTSDKGFNWYLDTSFSNEIEPFPESSKFPNIVQVLLLNKYCAVGISDAPIPKILHYTGSEPISVNESFKEDLLLSPNPTTDKLLLKEIPDGATTYEIYNQLGIKVSSGEISNEINVSALPTGIYFLKIGNEKPMKFVKVD